MSSLKITEIPSSILDNKYLMSHIFSFSHFDEKKKKESYILEMKLKKIIIQQKLKQILDDYVYKLSNNQVNCLQDYFYKLLLKDYDFYLPQLEKVFENLSKCQCCSRHCYGKPKIIDEHPSDLTTLFSGCRSCKCKCRQTMRFINRAVFEFEYKFEYPSYYI